MNKTQLKEILDKHKHWVQATENYIPIKSILYLDPLEITNIEDTFLEVLQTQFPNGASDIYDWFETDLAGNPNMSYDELWSLIENKEIKNK